MTDPSGDRDPTVLPNQVGKMSVRPGADDREVIFTRVFDAPRELVFKAWTDPALISQWWAPDGFTTPHVEIDLRPGGSWKFVMRGPDGVDLPSKGIVLEVDEPSRLVMTDTAGDMPQQWHDVINALREGDSSPLDLVLTVTFEETDSTTTVTLTSRFQSANDLDATIKVGYAIGWSQSFEHVAAVVKSLLS